MSRRKLLTPSLPENPLDLPQDFWDKRAAMIKARYRENTARVRIRTWLKGPYETDMLVYLFRLIPVETVDFAAYEDPPQRIRTYDRPDHQRD